MNLGSLRLRNSWLVMSPEQLQALEQLLWQLYKNLAAHALPFHGWAHICFVRKKAEEFAKRNGANLALVSAAALVHDLNYVAQRNSKPSDGSYLRGRLLASVGVPRQIIERIESLIREAELTTRGSKVSAEAAALSDADTLFKALPITPIILSRLFRDETGLSLADQARKIVGEQRPLIANNTYFYDVEIEREYGDWARTNVMLWLYVIECLRDPDVEELLAGLGVE